MILYEGDTRPLAAGVRVELDGHRLRFHYLHGGLGEIGGRIARWVVGGVVALEVTRLTSPDGVQALGAAILFPLILLFPVFVLNKPADAVFDADAQQFVQRAGRWRFDQLGPPR